MQPQTDVKFDKKTFERIKRTIRNMSVASKEMSYNSVFATEIPDEITIQLTKRCNLRCKHCFQWNDEGQFQSMDKKIQNEEIDFDIIEKVYTETKEVRPNMYLWGGETLWYREWDRFADLMVKYPRRTIFCTNGLLIEEKLESIIKISSNLELLISIDGFSEQNDAIRGKGTYKKIIKAIDLLLDLRSKEIFKGDIVIHTTLNNGLIPRMYEFLEFFEKKGVTSLYFIFPWYIPTDIALRMDAYFEENFSWLYQLDKRVNASWHSFTYSLSSEMVSQLIEQTNKINSRSWNIRVRFQPALETNEFMDFVLGKEIPAQKRSKCLAVCNRMNVLPDGKVTPCKLYPEFAVGDLHSESIKDIWNNERYNKCREIIRSGLMPVCSKCVLLYLNGR